MAGDESPRWREMERDPNVRTFIECAGGRIEEVYAVDICCKEGEPFTRAQLKELARQGVRVELVRVERITPEREASNGISQEQ